MPVAPDAEFTDGGQCTPGRIEYRTRVCNATGDGYTEGWVASAEVGGAQLLAARALSSSGKCGGGLSADSVIAIMQQAVAIFKEGIEVGANGAKK